MMRQRDFEDLLAAVSDEESLEARRAAAIKGGADPDEVRRLDRLFLAAEKRVAEAEGEDEDQPPV